MPTLISPCGGGVTPAAGAWALIYSSTLAAPGVFAASAISQAYTHLFGILIARGSAAGTITNAELILNADTGLNYSWQYVRVDGSTVTGNSSGLHDTKAIIADIPASTADAGRFGMAEFMLPNYTSAAVMKAGTSSSYCDRGASGAQDSHRYGFAYQVTTAITGVKVQQLSAGNLAINSSFWLYAI